MDILQGHYNRIAVEYNNTKGQVTEAKEYLKLHPDVEFSKHPEHVERVGNEDHVNQDYDQTLEPFRNVKYKDGSSFRHKSNGQGLIRDFSKDNNQHKTVQTEVSTKYDNDYDIQPSDNWRSIGEDLDNDYNTYMDDGDVVYNNKPLTNINNRDPRSKAAVIESESKDIDVGKGGIYGYKNVQKSQTRLLHDLNDLPTDILRDTYLKDRERQLKKSRFEQRDLKPHSKDNEAMKKLIDREKKVFFNNSETLWDLESEKEIEDKDGGYWRGKRLANSSMISDIYNLSGVPKITSMGALTSSLMASKNSIDLIFLSYWLSPKNTAQILLERDIQCISDKLKKTIDTKAQANAFKKASLEDLFQKQCLQERGINIDSPLKDISKEDLQNFPLLKQIQHLTIGQMTVYRLQLECVCGTLKKNEECVKFLKSDDQNWSSYLGKMGDGVFKTRN